MSDLDNARNALQPFGMLPGFIGALERFEAAVRANERSGKTRAAVLREVADRLAADAEKGTQEGFMRIYKRGAASKVREWADELADGTETPLSQYYEHPACGFHWHGRDGMDIPLRDGEPVCPRCELGRVSETNVQRVIDLYERWIKAGPPPLGASMARWWDTRLAELHAAIRPPKQQPQAEPQL